MRNSSLLQLMLLKNATNRQQAVQRPGEGQMILGSPAKYSFLRRCDGRHWWWWWLLKSWDRSWETCWRTKLTFNEVDQFSSRPDSWQDNFKGYFITVPWITLKVLIILCGRWWRRSLWSRECNGRMGRVFARQRRNVWFPFTSGANTGQSWASNIRIHHHHQIGKAFRLWNTLEFWFWVNMYFFAEKYLPCDRSPPWLGRDCWATNCSLVSLAPPCSARNTQRARM